MTTDDPSGENSESLSTRDRIKGVAATLYVLRGHDGFSFGDIAASIGTTRANIHHHFGNKRQLMDELIEDFVEDAELRIRRSWTTGDAGFFRRLAMQVEDLRSFYDRFNATEGERNMWSPLSRLRHDLAFLGEPAEHALERVNKIYDECLFLAVEQAKTTGNSAGRHAPGELVQLLRVTLLSCPPMTQDTGSFDEVTRTMQALTCVIRSAWQAR